MLEYGFLKRLTRPFKWRWIMHYHWEIGHGKLCYSNKIKISAALLCSISTELPYKTVSLVWKVVWQTSWRKGSRKEWHYRNSKYLCEGSQCKWNTQANWKRLSCVRQAVAPRHWVRVSINDPNWGIKKHLCKNRSK